MHEISTSNTLFGEITKGLNEASCVVACVSNEYTRSENCKLEFRFAHVSLKLPIVKAVVGSGNDWRSHEIAFLGGGYPEVNLQLENSPGLNELLAFVKDALAKSAKKNAKSAKKEETKKEIDDNNAAYQELYELTQRKFLKQLAQFCDKMETSRPYPRLFCVDLMEMEKFKVC